MKKTYVKLEDALKSFPKEFIDTIVKFLNIKLKDIKGFIFTFDDFEKLLSIDKEVNNVITHMYNFIYDSLLRLKQVLGEDDEILVTYEYDYNDNIVSEVRSGQTCKYKYNTKNSLIYKMHLHRV